MLQSTIRDAELAAIHVPQYLRQFGIEPGSRGSMTAGELWRDVLGRVGVPDATWPAGTAVALRMILDHGPLARRIVRSLGGRASESAIRSVYQRLCDCLATGRGFAGD
jgi:hypothetical protein